MPHFVISHDILKTATKGDAAFFFVSQGIKAALQQAKKAEHNKYVVVGGGLDFTQQFIRSGLLNEIQVHVVEIIIGAGIRLFENLDAMKMKVERANASTRRFSTPMIQHQIAERPREVGHTGHAVNPKSEIVCLFR